MPPRRASAETVREEKVIFPIAFERTVPPGSAIVLEYSVDGGPFQNRPLAPRASGGYSTDVEMDVGIKYKYRFRITPPGPDGEYWPEETPPVPAVIPVPAQPGRPAAPFIPGTPGRPAVPGTPRTPAVLGTPPIAASPGTPATPAVPGTPPTATTPGTPPVPAVPGTPPVVASPGTPATPAVPGTPPIPAVPAVPDTPADPGQAPVPGIPGSPAQPAKANYLEATAPTGEDLSLSPITPADQVKTRIKTQVKGIIDSLKNYDSAQGTEGLLQNLLDDMTDMNIVPDNYLKLIMENITAAIIEADNMPNSVKAELRSRPPRNFAELRGCLDRGGNRFRSRVFNLLKANPQARKAFSLRPGSTMTSLSAENARRFNKVCSEFFPGAEATAYMELAFDKLSRVPPINDPVLTARRNRLLQRVVSRLKPEDRDDFFSKIPAERKGWISDVLIQAGLVGVAIAGAPLMAGTMLVTKAAVEAFGGGTITDAFRRGSGGLGKVFGRNNVAARMCTTQDSSWSVFKNRMGEFLKRSIPGSAFWKAGKSVGEEESESVDTDEAETEPASQAIDELVRTACQNEIKGGAPRS